MLADICWGIENLDYIFDRGRLKTYYPPVFENILFVTVLDILWLLNLGDTAWLGLTNYYYSVAMCLMSSAKNEPPFFFIDIYVGF